MSEKRFEVINARWQGKGEAVAFEDTQTYQVYFAENQEECERIVELLNELYEEKEQMKKRLESSETTSDATSHYNAFLESKITTLEKENEQMRKELYNFKPVMFQDMQKGTVILYFKGDSDE